ncbi:hypothetical protein QLX08_007285 [Tetragonisca angustula]|uniref:Uncharacterized protein n=1 Tax=Tetragonisca angustula TaxID=166442 RepID=A0AAW0ZQF5_9HYME
MPCSCAQRECAHDVSEHSEDLSSTPEGLWQTPTDRSVRQTNSEFCSPGCVTPSTPISSRRKLFVTAPPATPAAPVALRQLRRRHDLRSGVAIASRRLDFDTIMSLDEEDVSLELDESQLMREAPCPLPSSTFRTPEIQRRRRILPPTLFRPRARTPPVRQHLPRIARMTPCGKCLRI